MASKTTASSETPEETLKAMGSIKISGGIEISANDDRDYRSVTLENSLQVLLISDPTTDKSAAALDCHVGHLSDPDNLPGLAHFLEHMLFMGTKKYPKENEYSEYLSANGGSSNAFTASAHTNYYFDITPPFLEQVLDRFSRFFINPLFGASSTDRELKAVDSENSKNLQNDGWRVQQICRSLAKSTHPYSKFGTGSLQTLKTIPKSKGIDTRKALLEFHAKYYSANIMKLVILGKEPLDTLEKWAKEKFSGIKNQNIDFPTFPPAPWGEEIQMKQFSIEPVKDTRYMRMTFQMPSLLKYYKEAPDNYLMHLLGHESEGSVFALLKKKCWAQSLYAGCSVNEDSFAAFDVTIELTEEGLKHVDDCALVVFQYLAMLKKEGPKKWIFDEDTKVSATSVKFMAKSKPFNYVSALAGKMHKYPAKHVILSGRGYGRKYGPQQITDMLAKLTPDNMFMFVVSKKASDFTAKDTLKEKWYGTKYKSTQISKENLALWASPPVNPDLSLPATNDFVATNLTISSVPSNLTATTPPRLLKESALCRLWYKKDPKFLTPKLNALVKLTCPTVLGGPDGIVLTELYTNLVSDALNEYSYYAELAGLSYSLSPSWCGLMLNFGGYNDKMATYASRILAKMSTYKVDPKRFAVVKEKMVIDYQNKEMSDSYHIAMMQSGLALLHPRYHFNQKLAAVQRATPESLGYFVEHLFDKVYSEILVHGNSTEAAANDFATAVVKALDPVKLDPWDHPEARVVQLAKGCTYRCSSTAKNPEEPCSAIQVYYQIGMQTKDKELALTDLLCHILREPFFDTLRTKEQLGYIVHAGPNPLWGVSGIQFIIHSDKAPCAYLENRISLFLREYRATLAAMSADVFDANRKAVVAKKREKPKKLVEETRRWWSQIMSRTYIFELNELIATVLEKVTLEDLLAFYDQFVASDAPDRRIMVSERHGNHKNEDAAHVVKEKGALGTKVEDYEFFKRSMPLYPVRAYIRHPKAAASALPADLCSRPAASVDSTDIGKE